MPDWLRSWWVGLSDQTRNVISILLVGLGVIVVLTVLFSFVFSGTDYSGLGEYVRSWFE